MNAETPAQAMNAFQDVTRSLSQLHLEHLAEPLAAAINSYIATHQRQLRALARPEPLTEAEEAALEAVGVRVRTDAPDLSPLAGVATRLAAIHSGSIPLKAAAARLGVNPSRLRQRIAARTLYALHRPGDRGWVIPAFQFNGETELAGFASVLPAIRADIHPVELERFLMLPQPDLEDASGAAMCPYDWLAEARDPVALREMAAEI
ncbi:hypothetical protein [Limimaricola litoreus]|uniref:Uncharacterized protein n=1 Tax=Limimaricola litoreus TaxID=2955316 RepID=A0A9X2FQE0_9RHOB|nr:hypothetical protein [Limimaricola litoreus]MCP1169852.1 hypothetical protein [Limimaricola litoreus]